MIKSFIIILISGIIVSACGSGQKQTNSTSGSSYKEPHSYNLKFIVSNEAITDPSEDKRSYYRIFINKATEGRTTIGLESQKKAYKTKLSPNKHLLEIKKFVLDKKRKKYIPLNNIHQPKPPFIYVTIPKDKIVVVKMKVSKSNKAEYTQTFEIK